MEMISYSKRIKGKGSPSASLDSIFKAFVLQDKVTFQLMAYLNLKRTWKVR